MAPNSLCVISNIIDMDIDYFKESHHWWCLVVMACCCHADPSLQWLCATVVLVDEFVDTMLTTLRTIKDFSVTFIAKHYSWMGFPFHNHNDWTALMMYLSCDHPQVHKDTRGIFNILSSDSDTHTTGAHGPFDERSEHQWHVIWWIIHRSKSLLKLYLIKLKNIK